MKARPVNDYLAHLLAQANRQVNQQLSGEGVSLENWRVLAVVAEEDGPTMRALARKISMHHPTVTKIIDKMVSEALVYRVPDPSDRRKVRIFISDKGRTTLAEQNARVAEHQGKVEGTYGAKRMEELKAMLESFILDGASYAADDPDA
jgi:DNA-binding MarR family transcriptional regulator